MQLSTPVPHVYLLPIPVPLPVRTTNCFALDTGDGFILIDAGMDTPEAREVWRQYFSALGLTAGRVHFLFVTHFHPDHLGLAFWLQDELDAPVVMTQGEAEMAQRYYRPSPAEWSRIRQFYLAHGVPEEVINEWRAHDRAVQGAFTLPSRWTLIQDGETRRVGQVTLLCLEQQGHTQHQGLLYWQEQHVLFTGDQVLARISPNISLWPGHDANPLHSYLAALGRLAGFNHPQGLGAHGPVVPDVNQRIDELVTHHEARNKKILMLLGEDMHSAYRLTHRLFPRPLDRTEERFAVGETLAHLEYLRHAGEVTQVMVGGHIGYRRLSSSERRVGHVDHP
ncbi:MAG: MBL fold metallo-hydrolase [Firmicutes bacterium]|nr:MBL fold metallo-hydrolase [Bacillota bacterium]